jgi:hypothetical protein
LQLDPAATPEALSAAEPALSEVEGRARIRSGT